MDSESIAMTRADIAALRCDVTATRQDISALEAKADSIEAWRVRYLVQEDQVINKLFTKNDEMISQLGEMRSELARARGERDAERRTGITIVSLLSAACGGLIASFFHG